MHNKKINPILQWWVTPKLPVEDIYESHNFFTQWIAHPIKRRLARLYLKFLVKYTNIKIIGVTGSAGKSTTVQIISSILSQKGKTLATPPSIDPVYNIPNTILRCLPGTKFLVLEMSVEYPGEMDFYLWLAQPHIGLINNIFPTHIKFLKSVDGVLNEKGKLVLSLRGQNIAILNGDDEKLRKLSRRLKSRVVFFKSSEDPLVHNVNAASMVAQELGLTRDQIKKGLESYKKPPHRFEIIKHKSGAIILDDTYNSNPEAVARVLKYFSKLSTGKDKVVVLGDMLDLGEIEEKSHRDLGKLVSGMNFKAVIGVGKASKHILEELKDRTVKTYWVDDAKSAFPVLKPFLKKDVYIMIKGSRSIHLEDLVSLLLS
jgi:UDP-N-acetylmuramoyl-tripeptide--D-alanyl-D-alanine ligase